VFSSEIAIECGSEPARDGVLSDDTILCTLTDSQLRVYRIRLLRALARC
jgi:hypothetical protein